MAISSFQFGDLGPFWPVEPPLVPFGQTQAKFKAGTVTQGDNGAEWIYLHTDFVATTTINQGDAFIWDASLVASRSGETAVTGDYPAGTSVGTAYLGAQTAVAGVPGGAPTPWSVTLPAGRYGMWFQRAGSSLLNVGNVSSPKEPRTPSTTDGTFIGRLYFKAPSAETGLNLIAPGTIMLNPLTKTFTADLLTGNKTATNVSNGRQLNIGMRVTGTGIPAPTSAPVTYITSIDGPTITLSAAPTASGTGVTLTAGTGVTSGNTTSGSPDITNVPIIPSVYPNQTITGTNFSSPQIVSISGTPGAYVITVNANASGTSSNILFTATTAAVPNYAEVLLQWPYFIANTV